MRVATDAQAISVDVRQDIGIPDGAALHQINAHPQQLLKFCLDPKEAVKVCRVIWREFDEEVGVTAVGLKVIGPGSGPEEFQAADAVAQADFGNAAEMLGDARVHGLKSIRLLQKQTSITP
jgi:hypothetical protein